MSLSALRWILVAFSIIIAIILGVQLYWLRQTYNLEQHQFKRNVLKSINALLDDIHDAHDSDVTVKQLVDILDPDTYIIRLQSIPPADSVRKHLRIEFEGYGVWTDCKVVAYSASSKLVQYNFYLAAPQVRNHQPRDYYPAISNSYNYLMLYFPVRNRYIIQEMGLWIRSASLLLITLIGLLIALMYLYRQKFLNELQKEFVNNFTHEFKTPLAVMKIASDVLINPDIIQQPERLLRYSHVIKEQTQYLQQRVDRLLLTARSEKTKMQLSKEPCLLSKLVEEALSQLEPLITSRQAIVNLEKPAKERAVQMDRSRMRLVLVNLIENAIKYSQGTPTIRIQVKANCLVVSDQGIGMSKDQLRLIFQKFYRVPTGDVHNAGGFGLGLHFVKKVIEAHKGKIVADSYPGKGTTFTIHLPS